MRRKAVWGSRVFALFLVLAGVAADVAAAPKQHSRQAAKAKPGRPSARVKQYRLDDELSRRADRNPLQTTRVIATLVPGAQLPSEFKRYARAGKLDIINGQVLDLPNGVLRQMASHPNVFRLHYDRPIKSHNYRTAVTVGAKTVQEHLGYTGAGVGIAVLDSGVATWHDDLTNYTSTAFPYGNQRVRHFVDFVNGQTLPYDDSGHGTHVSGTIAGNGYDSYGNKAGIAPDASLVSLKVLDANGRGTVSNIIAALNWVAENAGTYNIKVVNMSVGAGVHESYWTDPLTLAAKAVTDRGITVVAAAGNMGKNDQGALQHGGITAPGNAPWVLTVGASSTMGTHTRHDDQMASYSSSGPTAIDFGAKPDLVAPGTATISLAAPGSSFYATKAAYLVDGKRLLGSKPYLSLSGTSMAAPVVSGTVALMLQANPNLTPNLVKAILQYTAQEYPAYEALRQGAGFLNTLGAVRLARFYATAATGARMPVQRVWSKRIIWGNHRLKGGYPVPTANAWRPSTIWGAAEIPAVSGSDVEGGGTDAENIVWGTECADTTCDNILWSTEEETLGDANIVWGTTVVSATNVIWGSTGEADENIVWGTDCDGADCDEVVWGTCDLLENLENIVWGTADALDNVLWGTDDLNIVWGTSADSDVTWGNAAEDAVLYPDDGESEPLPSADLEFGEVTESAPAVTESTSAVTESAPAVTESTSVVTESAPAVTESTSAVTESAPAVTESTSVVTESAPAVTESTTEAIVTVEAGTNPIGGL